VKLLRQTIQNYLSQPKVIFAIYMVIGAVTGVQKYLNDSYNNFKIFRLAFPHLLNRQNLHLEYPENYYDIFLYHPTFSVFFAPFTYLPIPLSMALWNMLSTFLIYKAVNNTPLSTKAKIFVWWFVLVELITALQNMQTNPAIAALIVLAFTYFEKRQLWHGAFAAALGFFIKGYGGIAAASILLFKKDFWKNTCVYGINFLFLSILPAFFIGFNDLPRIYTEWFECLAADHKVNLGISLIGMLHGFGGTFLPPIYIQLFGVVCLLAFLAYVFFKKTTLVEARLLTLAYLLMWVILFNHAAESNTHIISIMGVAIWYVVVPKSRFTLGLLVFAFILTELSPSDVFPRYIRTHYVQPYALKALPIFLIWLRLHWDIITDNYRIVTDN
jgi:Glycosyltransferase family 87